MNWRQVPSGEFFSEAGDPYFQLRVGAAIPEGFASPDWSASRPVVVLLEEGQEATFADHPGVEVPAFYTDPIPGLEHTRWRTALANRKFFESLRTDATLRSAISRIAVLPPIIQQEEGTGAAIGEHPGQPSAYEQDSTVVIGIIDYGIAFAHERFRHSERASRIEYLWVQDAPRQGHAPGLSEGPQTGFTLTGSTPTPTDAQPVPYGQEIRARNIDHLLSAGGDSVDEDSLYRRAAGQLGQNWLRSVSRRVAHGTHVMDLACGYDIDEQERAQRPIVCVQLPEATTADTSGESLDAYALDGIRYILERADEIAQRVQGRSHLPVVINFSFGDVAGPHDGTSSLEAAIDELVRERRKLVREQKKNAHLEIVIPAGNGHLRRLHAELSFDEAAGEPIPLHWRVLPDDRTPSFLEIWLPRSSRDPNNPASRVQLSITSPTGLTSDPLDETSNGAGLQLLSDGGDVLCEARYRFIDPPNGRGMFLIALQPTRRNPPARPEDAANPVAPSGTWTVTIENMSLEPGDVVEAWVQRDDTPYGFRRRGRQSYFDEECYRRFDRQGRVIERDEERDATCIIKRAGSMNAIATGQTTFVVGGYIRESSEPAPYSAGGPVVDRWPKRGPDAIAVSDESRVLPGVLAAGTRSGSVVALNGTSVAAPQAARQKAKELGGWDPGGGGNGGSKPQSPGPEVERTGDKRIEITGERRIDERAKRRRNREASPQPKRPPA